MTPSAHPIAHSSVFVLVWLRPSKQIRAPVYTNKQRRQRRWIVIKYGIAYVFVIGIFVTLVALRKCLLCALYWL